jgi:imidazolonepropionase-like amidohydrolase
LPIQYLPLCAAFAHRAGLSEENALKAITINAAEILGISHRVGSLAEGKDADIIISNGSILSTEAIVETVIINGQVVYQDMGQPA